MDHRLAPDRFRQPDGAVAELLELGGRLTGGGRRSEIEAEGPEPDASEVHGGDPRGLQVEARHADVPAVRFDEFVLRGQADEEFRVRFHERLTVLAGVGSAERQLLVDAVIGGLTGTGDDAAVRGVDHTGRPIEIISGNGRVAARFADDGTSAPAPIGWFAPDAEGLRQLLVVTAEDLGASASHEARDDDPPELVEARAALRDLAAQLEAVIEEQRRHEAAKAELAELLDRIRSAEADAARREYARTLAELERVRAEAAVLQSGEHGAEAEKHLLESAEEAHRLAARWRDLAAETARARQATAGDEVLDPTDVARLLAVPETPPADLADLVGDLVRAAEHVNALEERLREVASASLPVPDDARLLTLASIDQGELWDAHRRLVAADAAASREQVAVGGIGAVGERATAISELEDAHAGYESACAVIEQRRVPVVAGSALAALLGVPVGAASPIIALVLCIAAVAGAVAGLGIPMRQRAAAARREAAALELVGVPTYLGFHLRRVDATVDPRGTLDRLADAQAELEAAQRSWDALSGGITADAAAEVEAEVRAYAAALASREGVVQEVAELRRTLDELAVPDLATARQRLALAVEPYGLATGDIDALEPRFVLDLVAGQVGLGHVARRQRALEEATADEEKVANRLDDLLGQLGFDGDDLEDRVTALDTAVDHARNRQAARKAARPMAEIKADIERLTTEARALRRPEWHDVEAADVDEPDVAALVARRDQLEAQLAEFRPGVDVERLQDRHAAVERRVTALEVQLRGERGEDADVEELLEYLLAALTRANHVGPRGEPVPVFLDDAFSRAPAERSWELMDMLERLSEKTQVMYLTDDPFIGAWARQRADVGGIALLEPVE